MNKELKTLNDLDKYGEGENTWGCKDGLVEISELRQEAIKWIQDRIINYVRFKTIWTKEQCEYLEEDFKFWMDRFNISEDDLK